MKEFLNHKADRLDDAGCESEVDAELCFHIELQTQEYERQGHSHEEALALAASRFGNVAQIRNQCVQIRKQNSNRTTALKFLFTLAFLLGVLVRVFTSGVPFVRVGDVLMMIGVLGGVLLYLKQSGTVMFAPERESFRLGLSNGSEAQPLSFDEKGRSPFERVRGDE